MSGINVNSEVGGYALGAIADTPFAFVEKVLQTGWLVKRNINAIGIQPGTDTEDFWWSKRITGYLQDNVLWASNLLLAWALSRYPNPEDSYLRRSVLWSCATPTRYVLIRSLVPALSVTIGFTAVFPDHPYSKFWRSLSGMSGDLTLSGVR